MQRQDRPARSSRAPQRRNNAPIRPPRRGPTLVPDFVLTLAGAAWTMAVVFFCASFLNASVTSGEAGRILARIFAGALFASGFFLALLAIALLRDERDDSRHYVIPGFLGLLIGTLESAVFFLRVELLIAVPFLLVLFVFPPLRRPLDRLFHPSTRLPG